MTAEAVPASEGGGRSMDAAVAAVRERALAVLREVVAPHAGRPWALIDFPEYANAGDSAIWLGNLAGLKDVGMPPPAYTCDKRTFRRDVLAHRVKDGLILVHGGGNFGDVYRSHQRLREDVVAWFPHNPVIQLPQSIHFTADEPRERARQILRTHPRYLLLVRDEPSLSVARPVLGLEARLCPDLAMCLGSQAARRRGGEGIVWLARGDAWRRHAPIETDSRVTVSDWPKERLSAHRVWASTLRRGIRMGLGGLLPLDPSLSRTSDRIARTRFDRALDWLGRADVVVTDRLHGHVLSLLLGTPHVLLNDRTGKVHALHAAWTRDVATIRTADDPAEALDLARGLLDAGPTAAKP